MFELRLRYRTCIANYYPGLLPLCLTNPIAAEGVQYAYVHTDDCFGNVDFMQEAVYHYVPNLPRYLDPKPRRQKRTSPNILDLADVLSEGRLYYIIKLYYFDMNGIFLINTILRVPRLRPSTAVAQRRIHDPADN